jgi:hypothetical protein
MSILNREPSRTITAAQVAENTLRQGKQAYDAMESAYEQGLQRFWKNPHATPQEISDALGTDAVEVFRLHGILGAAILAANPEATITDVATLGTFTPNEDGTITINSVLE